MRDSRQQGASGGIAHWLPAYDFREMHAVGVAADRKRIYTGAKELQPSEMPLVHRLFALRSLPARLAGRTEMRFAAGRTLLDQMQALGFVLLEDRPDEEIILGLVGQFWRPRAGLTFRPITGEEFLNFATPGYARAVVSLRIEPRAADACSLCTETRVAVTDAASRRKFAVYWLLIRPGSGIIRRMWLRAMKRRAESA